MEHMEMMNEQWPLYDRHYNCGITSAHQDAAEARLHLLQYPIWILTTQSQNKNASISNATTVNITVFFLNIDRKYFL